MLKKIINSFEIILLLLVILLILSLMFPDELASFTFRFPCRTKLNRQILDAFLISLLVLRIIHLIRNFKWNWKRMKRPTDKEYILAFLGFSVVFLDVLFWIDIYFIGGFIHFQYLIFSLFFSLPIAFWLMELMKRRKNAELV